MEKVALVVTIEFQAGAKAAFLQALMEHKQRCLDTEPGTLQFEIVASSDNPNSVVLFEAYASQEALTLHEAGPSLARFRDEAGALITKASAQHGVLLAV
ncbi:putative quinol monooxygenase [Pseudoduganella sp.]|uniref:putative quinol monooxygenase n=1 Tax=Pseudoduganella sp. TaxID=1880898 RepID=UPI0035B2EF82